MVKEFSETTYGGHKRLFINNDSDGMVLRYLQINKNDYDAISDIDYVQLLTSVHKVNILCEAFTITLDIDTYIK